MHNSLANTHGLVVQGTVVEGKSKEDSKVGRVLPPYNARPGAIHHTVRNRETTYKRDDRKICSILMSEGL
jgi:hypothetical protein